MFELTTFVYVIQNITMLYETYLMWISHQQRIGLAILVNSIYISVDVKHNVLVCKGRFHIEVYRVSTDLCNHGCEVVTVLINKVVAITLEVSSHLLHYSLDLICCEISGSQHQWFPRNMSHNTSVKVSFYIVWYPVIGTA